MPQTTQSEKKSDALARLSEKDLEAVQGGNALDNRQQVHTVSSGYKGADNIRGGKGADI